MDHKASTKQNQHYVPQFLLRGFTVAGTESVWVYDKQTGRIFRSSIRNVAAERGFYDYSVDGESRTLEPFFSRMEADVARVVQKLLQYQRLSRLSNDERAAMSLFVAAQTLRVKNLREKLRSLSTSLGGFLRDRGIDPAQVEGFRECTHAEDVKLAAIGCMPLAKEIGRHVMEKTWFLQKAPPGHLFYASDNPVTLHNQIERSGRGNLGFAVPGIEIYLALSSTLCLCFFCRDVFTRFADNFRRIERLAIPLEHDAAPMRALLEAHRTGRPLVLSPENVVHFNSLQVNNASRFVISADRDFGLAETMLREEPLLRDPPLIRLE